VSPRLIINPLAEEDLREAKAWHDNQRQGLGTELIDEISLVFDRIIRSPMVHAVQFRGLRIALARRFPYAVVYRLDDDQITVIAIYHTSRHPRTWQVRSDRPGGFR